jgi:hypothetical protein
MSSLYEESHRLLQRRFDTERLADHIDDSDVDVLGSWQECTGPWV